MLAYRIIKSVYQNCALQGYNAESSGNFLDFDF